MCSASHEFFLKDVLLVLAKILKASHTPNTPLPGRPTSGASNAKALAKELAEKLDLFDFLCDELYVRIVCAVNSNSFILIPRKPLNISTCATMFNIKISSRKTHREKC
jgi:hypothetical protein